MGFSVGIGLTNDCNLNCAHCYRPTDQIYHLSVIEIKTICQHLPVNAMGMGTGENGLHPQFLEIVAYLRDQGIKLTMASNGYSLNTIPDEYLCAFHDVEVSIDFPRARAGYFPWTGQLARCPYCHRAMPKTGDRSFYSGYDDEHQL